MKKGRRRDAGSLDRWVNVELGAKSVHVNDLSREGMAMNIREGPPGQICRWFGEMACLCISLGDEEKGSVEGGMWNSHQRVSMYSCW